VAGLPIASKKKMKQQAQMLVNNGIMVQPTIDGKTIQKFNELSKWWYYLTQHA
jgi:hypothetical protein